MRVGLGRLLRRLEEGESVDRGLVERELGFADAGLSDGFERVAGRVRRLQRRDRELSGLIASTRDLVEALDVPTVLQRLVDRAHQLTGMDVTYLSLYERETHELFVRACRGTTSPGFLGMRVPAGVGIASQVVNTGSAQWTADYWDAGERFDRDPVIDAVVRQEQLRGLLGVPMVAKGVFLGVLFAAERSVREFASEEIAVLTALADHAAMIVHNARLLEEAHAAADAAAEAHARIEAHLRATDLSVQVHEQLTQLVLAGHGPDRVVETLSQALERSVALVDASTGLPGAEGIPLGDGAGHWWVLPDAAELLSEAIGRSREGGRCERIVSGPVEVVFAVSAGGAFLGALLVGRGAESLTAIELRTIERAGQIVALTTVQRNALAEAEERVRGELAADLLSGTADGSALARRLELHGMTAEEAWVVVVTADEAQRALRLRGLASRERGILVVAQAGAVTVLVPEHRFAAVRPALLSVLGDFEAKVSVEARAATSAALPEVAAAAGRLTRLLTGAGSHPGHVLLEEYAPYVAMFGDDGALARSFVDAMIGPLVQWDLDNGSDLVATLGSFLSNGSSVTETARVLHIHVNTVKQRLARVSELLGEDWRTSERAFRLTVACRLHGILR